jgi:hypothetical protein
VDAKSPLLRRALYGIAVALIAAALDPATYVGETFASMRIKSGGGASNAQAFKSAVALGRKDFQNIDLHGADLSRAQLTSLRLEGANLTDVNFTGADLAWTNLEGANLAGANMTGVEGAPIAGLLATKCDAATKLPIRWQCDNGRTVRSPK